LQLYAELEQEADAHDQRRERVSQDDGCRPIGKKQEKVFH
jgi:hypothetical protein